MGLKVLEWWFNYKHGWPLTVSFFRFECFPKDGETIYREYEAADYVPLFKSGSRRGQKNWAKCTGMRVGRITESEWPAVLGEYEGVTGCCHDCQGEGRLVARISSKEGTSYKPCSRCHSTGKAPKETVVT